MDKKLKRVIRVETEDEDQQLAYYHYVLDQIGWTHSYKYRLVEVDMSEPCIVEIRVYKGCRRLPPVQVI